MTQNKGANPYYQAQAILARRDHSEAELRRKLARKRFSSEQIQTVIDRLKQQSLVDDVAFAKRYVDYAFETRQRGPHWIRQKLLQAGVAGEVIEVAVETITTERQVARAEELARRWYERSGEGSSEKLKRRLVARGFDFEVIQHVLGP